jgi:glycosyltransferase involved in cell wall biosynthesis
LKVAFLIRTFDVGGSERQLLHLARGLVERDHEVLVIVIERGGTLVPELQAAGVTVTEGKRAGIRALREFRPDVVHGYLPFANVVAVSLRPFLRGARVVLGVRGIQSERDPGGAAVQIFYRVEAAASRLAHLVIANSDAARDQAAARGFPVERVKVVHNGFDTDALQFDAVARKQLRSEWAVGDDEVLVGRVAQLRPTKDYETFLRAAAVAAARRPNFRFVVVGEGPQRRELAALASRLGLDERVVWAGARPDIAATMSALDVMVSSSRWESFPNVVGEAMACGVPCAVTDTGDSAAIVGPTGTTSPPATPDRLGEAVLEVADRVAREGDELRAQARTRIIEQFSIGAMVTRTERMLLDVLNLSRSKPRP